MNINLIGQRNILGGGTHFANFADSLQKLSGIGASVLEYDFTIPQQMNALQRNSKLEDANIYFFGFNDACKKHIRGKNIAWAVFETTRLPGDYIKNLSEADAVWVMSEWGKSVLSQNGLSPQKIDVVPEGVNPELFHPLLRSKSQNKDAFRFLCLGKYEERKGYSQLLEGFKSAFQNCDDVELLIKADYFIDEKRKHNSLTDAVRSYNCSNIKILRGRYSEQMLFELYNSVDAFVYPTRAEGWGLPLSEAVAMGLPTLATHYSGQTEFLNSITGLFIPLKYELVPISDEEFTNFWKTEDNNLGKWAEVDPQELAQNLRELIENYDVWQTKARTAAEVIRTQFSWLKAAEKSIDALIRRGWIHSYHPQIRY